MKQAMVKQTRKSSTQLDQNENYTTTSMYELSSKPRVSLTKKRTIDRKTLLKIIQKVEQL